MIKWLRNRSLGVRILVYAAAATLAFVLAAGVGAMAALTLRGDLGLPGREEPQPLDGPNNVAQPQEGKAAAEREEDASQQDEAKYLSTVGDIQAKAVETFLDSHGKLLHYDALTAEDVEEMQANEAALGALIDQISDIDSPQRYREQYEVFRSAINELHEAARLAHSLAADPIAATQSDFDEYDRHVSEGAALLQRSNALLDRDYKTIEGAQEVSPQLSATETVRDQQDG